MFARTGQLLDRRPAPPAIQPEPFWHPTLCGQLAPGVVISHGEPRRVVAVSRVGASGDAELIRIDLETGEQLHRYATDMVVVYVAHPSGESLVPARSH